VRAATDGRVVIRKAKDDAEVLINGVRLGPQPTLAPSRRQSPDRGFRTALRGRGRSGSTQYIRDDPRWSRAGKSAERNADGPPAASWCLTDGREHAVAGQSLVMGHDASSDVVLTGKNVSRRHAEIMRTPRPPRSTAAPTGPCERRASDGPAAARALRCAEAGDDEFRYADAAPAAPTPPPPLWR
jgi:hypothetical protein